MAEEASGWDDTCERFVTFLDIMGFKDRVYRENHEEVKKMLESLSPTISTIKKIAKFFSRSKKTATVNPVVFSDSIILVSSDKSEDALIWIIIFTQLILANAIIQEIPIKGAIACGMQTADFKQSLHFGKPLIDAYELQNELQLYGVVLHHSAEKRFSEIKNTKTFEDDNIFKYPVPMKSGKITHYIVDWTGFLEKEKDPLNLVSNLYNNVSGTPRIYVDNTLEFVKWLEKTKAELSKEKKSTSKSS